jgi:hypothetical protein
VPADSQVEYGTTASYGGATAVSPAKVTSHAVAISGLTGGTTYHFRVRSSDANGSLVVGPDYALTVSIPVTISLSPQSATIAANGTQQFTATVANNSNHSVSWSATAGSVSSSGLFTAPSAASATPVTITATSQADTTKSASIRLQIGSAQAPGTMLLGHSTLEPLVNGISGGTAEGYQITASDNGSLSTLSVYVDATTTATNLFVGLYSDNNGHPGSRLTGGNSTVLLGTGGLVSFRQKQNPGTGGWVDELNAIKTLTALPATWTTGTVYSKGAWTSVYGSGVTSAPPLTTSILSVSPAGFSWTAKVGTSSVAPASVSITNTGTGSLTFSGATDQPWLAISSAGGTAPATLQILPSTSGLAAGTYTGHVRLTSGGTTKTVTVVLTMTAPPTAQHTVSLVWQAPASKVISYSMYRSTIQGSSYGMVASAIGGNSYIDQSVQSGTPYCYVVTAVDSLGRESKFSNEIKAAIP